MMVKKQVVRTRIAPSPTGLMHIGTLRTALMDYVFAKHFKGQFLIRLEDTDRQRLVEGAAADLVKVMHWAGLEWDEGIDLDKEDNLIEKGDRGPYVQSDRLLTYKEHVQKLIEKGAAYYCFCSKERLEELRKTQEADGRAPGYDRCCLHMPKEEVEERLRHNEPYVVRFKIEDEGETVLEDLVRGKVVFQNDLLDDPVILKADGYPTYHLAAVVDDHLMGITHVFRSEEWLPSTPKHIMLYQAFGWEVPQFGHLGQLLNLNGKKLSKRDGDVSMTDFINKGYLREAIINYIALLGWNPKSTQEFFTLEELVEQFDVKKINRAGAKFDYARLNWFNNHYIKQLEAKELVARLKLLNCPAAETLKEMLNSKEGTAKAERIIAVQKERANALGEFIVTAPYFLANPEYAAEMLLWKGQNGKQLRENLKKALEAVESLPEEAWFEWGNLQEALMVFADPNDRGALLWPLRMALTGAKQSPSPFECLWVLGKAESLERLRLALKKAENVV